jgi:hypothetical protein
MRVKCGKIRKVYVMLKKLDTSSMNQIEDYSVTVKIDRDDWSDGITSIIAENDVTVDMDNEILVKSEVILNPIHEKIKCEDVLNDCVEYKADIQDFDDYKEDIIDIVHHKIEDEVKCEDLVNDYVEYKADIQDFDDYKDIMDIVHHKMLSS